MNNNSIRHSVIDGSSNWVIGRNVTSVCNIQHTDRNVLALPDGDDYITMIHRGFHSFIRASVFVVRQFSHRLSKLLTNNQLKNRLSISLFLGSNRDAPWIALVLISAVMRTSRTCAHSSYEMVCGTYTHRYISYRLQKMRDLRVILNTSTHRDVSLSRLGH